MKQKQRKHLFFDRFTIPGMIVLILTGWIGTIMLGSLIATPIKRAIGHDDIVNCLCIVSMAFVILALYKFWFRPDFEGNLRGGDFKTGIKLLSILIIFWAVTVPVGFVTGHDTFGAPTAATICASLAAGCCEEAAFRGLALSYLMRQWKDEKHIVSSVMLTSVIFGAVHMINASGDVTASRIAFQAVSATGSGIFYAVLYLRSGNLVFPMAAHTVHNILAYLDVSIVQNGMIVTNTIDWTNYFYTGTELLLGLFGLWLIRSSVRTEIREMWDRKWNITLSDAPIRTFDGYGTEVSVSHED